MPLTWTGWSEVPGGGLTNVGLAAIRDVAGFKMALFAAGEDDRIFLNSTPNDRDWSGWSEVPGGGRTKVALSAGRSADPQNQNLVLYAAGEDQRIFFNSTNDGTNWSGWSEVQGGGFTTAAPCAAYGNLFIAGLNQEIYVNPLLAQSGWTEVPGGGRTTEGLCANGFNFSGVGGATVIFAKGLDERIYENVYSVDGNVSPEIIGKWQEVPGNGVTSVALTVAPAPNSDYIGGYLFAMGAGNRIFFNECDGWNNWNGWAEVPGGGLTDVALAAVTDTGLNSTETLFLFAKGLDQRVYWDVGTTE